MSQTSPPATRSFSCQTCRGEIQIPYELPPTSAPCPHCGATVTSPPPPGVGAGSEAAEPVPAATSSPPPPVPVGMPEVSEYSASEVMPPRERSRKARREKRGKRPRRGVHPAIPFLVAILLIVGVLVGLIVMKRKDPELERPVAAGGAAAPPKENQEARMKFLRDGWKEHSAQALGNFLRAETVEDKARYVIGGKDRLEEMKAFYGEVEPIKEGDTPIEAFSYFDLDIADKKRGLFLMQYDRPTQIEMGEYFRPVVPLEVQHNLEQADLLLASHAARENYTMESMRVMAFFRETDGKLLLDWDVYAQTKYRTLRQFYTHPQPGKVREFRVMVREEPPVTANSDLTRARYFRLSDPAHPQDHVVVPVAVNSLPGRILMDLAWVHIPGRRAQDRYATVVLGWSVGEEPRLSLRKLLCWEFLGLGGMEGNADPVEEVPPAASPGDPAIPGAEPAGPDPSAPPGAGVETVGGSAAAIPGGPEPGGDGDSGATEPTSGATEEP